VRDVDGFGRRPWLVNVVVSLGVVWCAAVWFGVLYLLGVSF
jgi:hypothetical protein